MNLGKLQPRVRGGHPRAVFIATIEKRQGLKIDCIEEIAVHRGTIDAAQFRTFVEARQRSGYRDYLRRFAIKVDPA